MNLTLYSFFLSSAAYRVRIALNLKGLAYETVTKNLREGVHRLPDFLELNPQRLVPVLDHDGERFNQSLAIIEYLDEIMPTPRLLPEPPRARAIVRAMALIVACEMHPLCNLRVLRYLREELRQDQAAVGAWYAHWMAEGFGALEALVSRHGGEGHCFGDSPSLADVCLVPQVYNATRFECDLSPYPFVVRIAEHLEGLPAFAAARPDLQPDAH